MAELPAGSAHTAEAHDSHDDISKHIRGYLVVFVALACLTALTVGVAYLKLARPIAITVALIIATTKASLVAAFFMHLISEKKVIYAVLILTAFFFLLVLLIPTMTSGGGLGEPIEMPAHHG